MFMYHHLPMMANQPIYFNYIGCNQTTKRSLCAGCSDVAGVAWTNAVSFASFSALYLCVSNNLLTHTSDI